MKRRKVSKTKQQIIIFIVLMLMISVGYASLSSTLRINGKADVKAKSFDVHFDKVEILKGKDSEIEKSRAVIDEEDNTKVNFTINFQNLGDEYEFSVDAVNSGDIDAMITSITPINLGSASSYIEIKITYIDGSEIKTGDRLNADNIHTYKITVKYKEDATNLPETDEEINLSFSVEYQKNNGSGTDPYLRNNNIVAVYNYNEETGENRCINGEEDTCMAIRTSKTTTYSVGTIIKYKVNENEEKYFYVLHDDGDKLTLQQRENTITATPWYLDEEDNTIRNNTKGPLNVLPILEEITSGWSNVNTQIYTMGEKNFSSIEHGEYTGCYDYGCSMGTRYYYNLGERIAKARMITLQESYLLKCTRTDGTCLKFMNNYLTCSQNYDGTQTGIDSGYWTMQSNANSSALSWAVRCSGMVDGNSANTTGDGARAVIEINK